MHSARIKYDNQFYLDVKSRDHLNFLFPDFEAIRKFSPKLDNRFQNFELQSQGFFCIVYKTPNFPFKNEKICIFFCRNTYIETKKTDFDVLQN